MSDSLPLSRPHPIFFGPPSRPLFGWMHPAANADAARDLAVVACNPLGYEAVLGHRTVRHVSIAFAELAIPTLRFDYDGTGDSAGTDEDPDRVEAWVRSIHAAIELTKARTGAGRVVLLGLRLGALLAAEAARQRTDCVGLIALAPAVSGRAHLRELRAFQLAMGLGPPPDGVDEVDGGAHESAGFRITRQTREAISALGLAKLLPQRSLQVLVLDRAELPTSLRNGSSWVDAWEGAGAQVTLKPLPGFEGMMRDPHLSVVPDQMIEAARAWLVSAFPLTPMSGELLPPWSARRLAGSGQGSSVAPGVSELPVLFSKRQTLFGVLSTPADGPGEGARGLILLNAGAQPHTGPNRLSVTLARRWAARGHTVLRFDLAGIGDSDAFPGGAENLDYPDLAFDDLANAIELLREARGCRSVDLVGLCSGAYHALKAAVRRLPVARVVAINPLTFFKPLPQRREIPPYQATAEAARYRRAFLSLESWRKVLRGDAHVRKFSKVVLQRASDILSARTRGLASRLNVPVAQDLASELLAVAHQKIPMHFIFSEGDPGQRLLLEQGGDVVQRLCRDGAISIDTIAGPDHTFTPLWSHPLLIAKLDERIGPTSESRHDGRRNS